MGQAVSSQQAPTTTTHGVITFSNDLVKKLADECLDVEPEPLLVEEQVRKIMPDHEWFQKIKAIDENHSCMCGFTVDSFNNLAEKIEFKLNDVDTKVPYVHDQLVNSMKSNSFSMYSSREVKNYIDYATHYQKNMLKRRLFEQKLEDTIHKRNKRRYIY